MLFFWLLGCQADKDTGEALFEDGVSPVMFEGRVWCNSGIDESGAFYLFFLEATAADPQGDLDLKEEASWTATIAATGQVMVEDVLYWEDGKYVYSFHSDQHPNIKCETLTDFRFVASTTDWSGHQSNQIELVIDGYVPAEPN